MIDKLSINGLRYIASIKYEEMVGYCIRKRIQVSSIRQMDNINSILYGYWYVRGVGYKKKRKGCVLIIKLMGLFKKGVDK